MSPSTIPFSLLLIFLSLTSMANNIAARSTLIEFACFDQSPIFDKHLCLQILPTIPKVAAATDLINLSLAIIDAGISNATATRRHIEKTRAAGKVCKYAYDEVVGRFSDARKLVRESEFSLSTYELLTASTDYVKLCEADMAKKKVKDAIIRRGNRVVPVFGLSANKVVEELVLRSAPPLPPPPPPRRS